MLVTGICNLWHVLVVQYTLQIINVQKRLVGIIRPSTLGVFQFYLAWWAMATSTHSIAMGKAVESYQYTNVIYFKYRTKTPELELIMFPEKLIIKK